MCQLQIWARVSARCLGLLILSPRQLVRRSPSLFFWLFTVLPFAAKPIPSSLPFFLLILIRCPSPHPLESHPTNVWGKVLGVGRKTTQNMPDKHTERPPPTHHSCSQARALAACNCICRNPSVSSSGFESRKVQVVRVWGAAVSLMPG